MSEISVSILESLVSIFGLSVIAVALGVGTGAIIKSIKDKKEKDKK
jgi:hypothetical protein